MPVETRTARRPEMESDSDNSFVKGIDAWEEEGGAISAALGNRVISISRAANPGTLARARQAQGERRARSRCAVIPIFCRKIQ
jgi:hypothetical protein